MLHEKGHFKEAEKHLLIAAENNHARAMNQLGILYELMQNSKKAEKWYRKAAKEHSPAMCNLGIFFTQRGDNVQAIQCHRDAIKRGYDPSLIKLAYLLPPDEVEEKEYLYKQALDKGVEDTELFYYFFLCDQKRFEEAAMYFEFYDRASSELTPSNTASDSKHPQHDAIIPNADEQSHIIESDLPAYASTSYDQWHSDEPPLVGEIMSHIFQKECRSSMTEQ